MSRKIILPQLLVILFIYSGCSKSSTESSPQLYNGVLTGNIFDPINNIPVSGATVSLFSGKNVAITDVNGNFEIDSLPIGEDKLTISKASYITLTDSVFIITDRLTVYNGFLNPNLKGWITGWQSVASGTSAILTNASYATSKIIYVCGFGGTLLRSVDGGGTWNQVTTPTSENLYCVHFTDLNTGIIMGNNGTILRTTNAGSNWTSLGSNQYNFRNVSFSDALHGTAVGGNGNSGPALMKTTDGGATWQDQSANLSSFFLAGQYGVSFSSPTTGYIAGTEGKVLKTTDGGSTWSSGFSGGPWIRSMFSTDQNNTTFVGSSGTIRHTSDGGFSWPTQGASPNVMLNGVSYSDSRHGTVVGENGTIMHTRTSGSAWINESINGFGGQLYNSAFADSIHGVIVGENGAILTPVLQ